MIGFAALYHPTVGANGATVPHATRPGVPCCDPEQLAEAIIMLETISLEGPVDLATLDDFLGSEHSPPECMQLSELDGFLAGIVVGPELIPPSVWLPIVWGGEAEPGWADLQEAQTM